MEVYLEILKDVEIAKKLIADFSMKEEYYKFHNYIKKSGVKFEIQEHHDLIILPIKYSENEKFCSLFYKYYKLNPIIKNVFETITNQGLDKIYTNNANTVSSNLLNHKKFESLNLISKSISNSQIQLGENVDSSPILTNLLENIDSLAAKYQTPIDKLSPRFQSFFYEEMLRELAKKKFISIEFLDSKIRFEWVNFAFYFSNETHKINSSILTLNWLSSSTRLADFLMFLFSKLIEYKFEDKREFFNWIILHIEIKGKPIKKDSTSFLTLNRLMKKFKDNTSFYFRINDSNLFEAKYFVPPSKAQELL